LAEPSVPPPAKIPADSNVEMSWRVFGGRYHELYTALLKERCLGDGIPLEEDLLAQQFRLHLHRGIAYLASDRTIRDGIGVFVSQALS
jgi:DNA sulfur modification protein DndE